MRFAALLPVAAAASLALGLSACANHPPLVPQESFVDRVDVELRPEVSSPTIAAIVAGKTRRESTRYGRTGEPKHLRIAITRLHYKNPVMSVLVGDSNNIHAEVSLTDGLTGKPVGQFRAYALENYVINGVIGAAIAVGQDRAQVNERLAEGLASDVMERVYGTAVAKVARERPTLAIEEPAPAPAPAAPAKPVPAPAKVKEPKTAMAGAPPPPVAR